MTTKHWMSGYTAAHLQQHQLCQSWLFQQWQHQPCMQSSAWFPAALQLDACEVLQLLYGYDAACVKGPAIDLQADKFWPQ
jgi:hypothetical protein